MAQCLPDSDGKTQYNGQQDEQDNLSSSGVTSGEGNSIHTTPNSDTNALFPKLNDTIRYRATHTDEWCKEKILSRGGKQT